MKNILFVFALLSTVPAWAAGSASTEASAGTAIDGRLSIGTRITTFTLLDDERSANDRFLGHITFLEDEQDYAPTKIFIDYFFNKYWGVEVTWDKIEADLINNTDEETKGDSDGTLTVDGPILTVVGRYPNESHFTPYGGAGVAILSGSVDESDWWHFGFRDEADYVDAGSPQAPHSTVRRHFEVDDTTALVVTLGVAYAINPNWSVDLYGRYMNAEMDAEALGTAGSQVIERIPGEFVLDNLAFGAGAKYTF